MNFFVAIYEVIKFEDLKDQDGVTEHERQFNVNVGEISDWLNRKFFRSFREIRIVIR